MRSSCTAKAWNSAPRTGSGCGCVPKRVAMADSNSRRISAARSAAERALLPSTAVRERESGLALGAVVTRHLHSLSGLGVIAATPRAVLLLGLEEGTCLRGRHHEARRIELDHGALHDVLRLRH